VALDFIDCPDRRLTKAATDLVEREVQDPGTHVTVILPRRSYSPLLGRLLHDRTADKIAATISRLPRSAATIVPYDVPSRVQVLQQRRAAKLGQVSEATGPRMLAEEADVARRHDGDQTQSPVLARTVAAKPVKAVKAVKTVKANGQPDPSVASRPVAAIASIVSHGKFAVEGKVYVIEIRPVERNSVLAVEISDRTGNLTAMFYGRSHIPGLVCGARVRFVGSAGMRGGQPVMINPAYELLGVED